MSPLSFSAPKSSWSPAMIISMIASFELKVNNVNHLDIPAQLAFILSKLDTWKPVVHMEKSLAKVSGQVPGVNGQKLKLPHDIFSTSTYQFTSKSYISG